jgi:hypothetical protein
MYRFVQFHTVSFSFSYRPFSCGRLVQLRGAVLFEGFRLNERYPQVLLSVRYKESWSYDTVQHVPIVKVKSNQ